MPNYTDVFGNYTLPPSEYGYSLLALVADATAVWPYNSDGGAVTIAKVMDVSCNAGNTLTLPSALEVSVGEDFLLRNIGANVLTVNDAAGVQIATVAVGAASYFYLTDNTTAAGIFGVIGFGVGTSTVDAASLVGYGVKAIGASLNQSHPVVPSASGISVDNTYRAKLLVFTGGTGTFSLVSAGTLGNDYFVMFRNDGTGTATIDPAASETIDGQLTMQVQPGESLMLICTGTQWYSVGYGRSTLYQFTQLTKDVSAGGTVTLTAAEASNKLLTFIGNPAGAVSVIVPSIVAVYYTYSNISTTQTITVKTAAGFGTSITQGARIIAICDGTNVLSAQSAVANTSVSLTDGSAAVPAIFFATQTNTGIFKHGTVDIGFTVAGVQQGWFGTAGLAVTTIGQNDTQRHTVPAVASDTLALLAAVQTLTNKSISGTTNTLSAIGNASLVNSGITINGSPVSLGGSVTVTATASSALTIGTGLSGTSYNGSAPVTITIDATVATLTGVQTLTNKGIDLASNTLTGTIAQFNAALTGNDFATLAGVETLTNKTINGSNNTVTNISLTSGITGILPVANGGTNASTGATALVNLGERTSATGSEILPAGTTGQRDVSPVAGYFRFNTTDATFEGYNGATWAPLNGEVTLAGVQTLTNKTLIAAKLDKAQIGVSGTATQNFTLTAEADDGTMKLARGLPGATTQDVMTVNASGVVAFPQNTKVGFEATQGSSGITTSGIIPFSTVVRNDGSYFSSGRFTPLVAGYYSFTASATFSVGSMSYAGIELKKNGSIGNRSISPPYSSSNAIVSVSQEIYMNGTTDYVECWYAASPTGGDVTSGKFQGSLVQRG